MKAIVLLNPSAGSLFVRKARSDPARVAAAFAAAGLEADVRVVAGEDLQPAVHAAARRHADMLVVGGGDGTVRAAAAALVGTGMPLGVLPLGTFNHFARDIGMPFHLDRAVAALAAGSVRPVDVAEVNGHIFVNSAVMGSYPRLVEAREKHRQRRRISKWRAAVLALGATLYDLPSVDLTLTTPTIATSITTSFLLVGNNRYGVGPRDLGRRTRLDEGVLSVYAAFGDRRRDAFGSLFRAMAGVSEQGGELQAATLTELTVGADAARVAIAFDGEVRRLAPPLRFSLLPGALRVVGFDRG